MPVRSVTAPPIPENRRAARKVSTVAKLVKLPNPNGLYYLIPRDWFAIAPVMACAVALMGFFSGTVPPASSAMLAVGAMGIAAATGHFVRIERKHGQTELLRYATMLGCIAVPQFLFGAALVLWDFSTPALDELSSIGALVIVATIATVLLAARLPSIISSQIAIWIMPCILGDVPGAVIALVGAAVMGVVASIRQFRAQRLAEEQQREALRRQARAEDILSDYEQTGQGWFWETDRRGTITYLSPIIGIVLGKEQAQLIARPFTELFDPESAPEGERTLAFHLSARSSFQDLAVHAAVQGEERFWSINGRPIFDEYDNFIGFRGSGSDLTEKRRTAEDATRLALFDSLTGLANRFQMAQTLEKILGAQRLEDRVCSVLLLDLDRFKQVNDTMGHPAGDALLKQVAQRLERAVDSQGRVGRLGGDEFEVVLAGRSRREDLAELAGAIIDTLSQPYSIDGSRVVIGVSIGIALAPEDGVTSEALIRNADLALYAAKDGGRGRFHFYAADLHSDAEERRQLEQDLRDAITQGGLSLSYQPVVNTVTERIAGFEALLRWDHPKRGPMSPAKFIPIAEDTGLIAPIGEWVLRTACKALADWPDDIRVSVNVSPLQFANPALPAIITSALAAAQVDPSRLELEITESVFLNDDEGIEAMFAALKRVGVRLALDDFGTGYSSLGYLKRAPFDKIKIDQSFVRGAAMEGSRNGAIIAAIVSLAGALGMETTAEGVETHDELDLVRMLGCSHVQGYIYEKPMSAAAALGRIATGLHSVARGPRSNRPARQMMLRKVVLENGGNNYHGTIRNISATGALVEGLWNVPPGSMFRVFIADGQVVTATARWCHEDRMGLEFASTLPLDERGRIALANTREVARR